MSDWADVEASMDELREEANVIAMTNFGASAPAVWERLQTGKLFAGRSWAGARRLAQIHEALGGRW